MRKKYLFLELICFLTLAICCSKRQGEAQTQKEKDVTSLYLIKQDGKWGYIDVTGNVVIEPQFNAAYDFSGGLALVSADEKWTFIDEKGKSQFEFSLESSLSLTLSYEPPCFKNNLAPRDVKGKWGYINKKAEVIIEPHYERAGNFCEGLAVVRLNKKYGYITTDGTMVIEPQFDEEDSFSEGLARIRIDKKWGFVDIKGNIVIDPKFKLTQSFSEGLAAVSTNGIPMAGVLLVGGWGYIDKKGTEIIKQQFAVAKSFSEGLAPVAVVIDRVLEFGFIDKKGKFIIKPQFAEANCFSEGLASVRVGKNWGFIDKTGREVIPPKFTDVRDFYASLALVFTEGGFSQGVYSDGDGSLTVSTDIEGEAAYIDKKGQYVWGPSKCN